MKSKPHPRTLKAKDVMRLDQLAASQYRIPTLILMENAGRSIAHETLTLSKKGLVVIISGNGNNGGDGFAAARHLANQDNTKVKIWIVGKPERFKPDTVANYQMITAMHIPTAFFNGTESVQQLKKDLRSCSIVIDALFGVGLNRKLEEPYSSLVKMINHAKKPVIAIDVPSGLNADTGSVMGSCVKAHTTITLSAAKPGLYVNEGPAHAGNIKIADISIPKALIQKAFHGKI